MSETEKADRGRDGMNGRWDRITTTAAHTRPNRKETTHERYNR